MKRPAPNALLRAVELLVARGLLVREPNGSLTAGDGVPAAPLDVAPDVFRWPTLSPGTNGAPS